MGRFVELLAPVPINVLDFTALFGARKQEFYELNTLRRAAATKLSAFNETGAHASAAFQAANAYEEAWRRVYAREIAQRVVRNSTQLYFYAWSVTMWDATIPQVVVRDTSPLFECVCAAYAVAITAFAVAAESATPLKDATPAYAALKRITDVYLPFFAHSTVRREPPVFAPTLVTAVREAGIGDIHRQAALAALATSDARGCASHAFAAQAHFQRALETLPAVRPLHAATERIEALIYRSLADAAAETHEYGLAQALATYAYQLNRGTAFHKLKTTMEHFNMGGGMLPVPLLKDIEITFAESEAWLIEKPSRTSFAIHVPRPSS